MLFLFLQVAKDVTSRTGKVILSASLQNGTVVFTGVMVMERGKSYLGKLYSWDLCISMYGTFTYI